MRILRYVTFEHTLVYSITLLQLNSLEYLHDNEYVHADIKGANLLIGRTKSKRHEVRACLLTSVSYKCDYL